MYEPSHSCLKGFTKYMFSPIQRDYIGNPKTGSPKKIEWQKNRNMLAKVLIFLLYSYYILRVPCLWFPAYSL